MSICLALMIPEGRPTTGRPKKGSYRERRARGFYIRIGELDLRKLRIICERLGITRTDYILSAIDRDYERIIADVSRKGTGKAKKGS